MKIRVVRWLTLAAAALPALLPLWLILKYGVDFPYWDEWDGDLAGLYVKAHQHQLTFADLVRQHNEHRVLVPRLIYIALAAMTHWSEIAELIVQWLFVLATSLLLLALCRRTESEEGFKPVFRREPIRGRTIFLWFVANLLIFSPAAWENWLWGIGLQNVLPMFFIALALLVITSDWRPWLRVIVATLIAVVSMYSSGNGLLCWPLMAPFLFWPLTRANLREKRWLILVSSAAFVLFTALYFVHYTKPDHRGTNPYATGIIPIIKYVPIFLGLPFAFTTTYGPVFVANLLGAVQLFLVAGAIAGFTFFWIRRDETDLAERALLWIAVAGFAIFSGVMAAAGRAGTAVEQALSSPRYVSYAVYLPVALVMLTPIFVDRLRKVRPDLRLLLSQIPAALVAVLIVLQVLTYPGAIRSSKMTQMSRREGKAALLLIQILPDNPRLTTLVFPDPEPTLALAKQLNRMGYIRPPLIENRDARKIEETDAARVAGAKGQMEQLGQAGQGIGAATGWAIMSRKHSPADAVFLTYDDEHGVPMIFAFADIGAPRQDIVQKQQSDDYASCGWIARFPVTSLPSYMRVTTLRAWALDTDNARAFRLDGAAQVQP